MSWNSTVVTVVGHVASEVSFRQGEDGRSNAYFRLNSTERRYSTAAGEWEDGETLWLGVTCWRKLADSVRSALSKGDPVIVQGKLRMRHVEKDDTRRTTFTLDASHVGLDLSRVQSLGSPPVVEPLAGEELVAHTAPF